MFDLIRCKDCQYWQHIDSRPKTPRGQCRAHAPRAMLIGGTVTSNVVWPRTKATDWCADADRKL